MMTVETDEPTTPPTSGASPRPPTPATATTTSRLRRWLPWIAAVLALAVAITFAVLWVGARGDLAALRAVERDRGAVIATSEAFVRGLTNWDASDGLDTEIAALRERGTGPFLDELDFMFGGDLAVELEANGVTSQGEIEESFVQDVDGDTAEAFVVVQQTYVYPDGPGPTLTLPATLTLEQQPDGTWLVREVRIPQDDQLAELLTGLTEESS